MSSGNGSLLTARQVAERLNVSIAWVHDHTTGRHLPVLPSVKLGKTVRFEAAKVEIFIEQCCRARERSLSIQ